MQNQNFSFNKDTLENRSVIKSYSLTPLAFVMLALFSSGAIAADDSYYGKENAVISGDTVESSKTILDLKDTNYEFIYGGYAHANADKGTKNAISSDNQITLSDLSFTNRSVVTAAYAYGNNGDATANNNTLKLSNLSANGSSFYAINAEGQGGSATLNYVFF